MPKATTAHLKPLLIKFRIQLRGNSWVRSIDQTGTGASSTITFPANLQLEPYTTFSGIAANSLVSMGAFSYVNGSRLLGNVSIGRYTSIGQGCRIMGGSHPIDWTSTSPVFYGNALAAQLYSADTDQKVISRKFSTIGPGVKIGNDVWIGEHVTLNRGITIGDGAVVAANATVTKDVPPYAIVAGLPAKVIRFRFEEDIVETIRGSQWWRYSPDIISQLSISDPKVFSTEVRDGALAKSSPFLPPKLDSETISDFLRSVGSGTY